MYAAANSHKLTNLFEITNEKKNPISIITFCFIFNFEVILRRNCKLLGTEVNLVLLSSLNSQVSDYGQYN